MTTSPNPTPSNVDQDEINKFSDLAHRWWDMGGEFKSLHAINPLRLAWIQSHAPLTNKLVLDVGCGGGILADSMARQGAQVLGIDLAEKSLKVAKIHALETKTPHIQYRAVRAEDLAAEVVALHPQGLYDVVTCMEMLEHVPDPAAIVQACSQLVKPGGWVFFSTFNRSVTSFLLAVVGAEYVLNLLPRGTHNYEKFIKPSTLAHYCRSHDLELKSSKGLAHNPLSKRYWLTDSVQANYLFATQKIA